MSDMNPFAQQTHSVAQLKASRSRLRSRQTAVAETKREELAQALVDIGTLQSEAAFCLVYDHFAGRVKSFFVGKGLDEDTAEELMQEIMITVWRKADTYVPAKAAASTWIFTIARNRRIDYLRGNYRVEIELDDALLEREQENTEIVKTQDSEVYMTQISTKLYEALDELPKEQRQVMHLAYFKGQSHGEIADWLDLPIGTVKSRIRLALQRVRDNLQDVTDEEQRH